jgi:hypothetical protein
MSYATLVKSTETAAADRPTPTANGAGATSAKTRPQSIASILAKMTFAERIRAYEKTFTSHELSAAAAREPEQMPILNGEFEWITWNLADLD